MRRASHAIRQSRKAKQQLQDMAFSPAFRDALDEVERFADSRLDVDAYLARIDAAPVSAAA